MLSQRELLELKPPAGLSDEELQEWWEKQICEPDGTLILGSDVVSEAKEVTAR
jgi:hypothetical protein